MFMGDYRHSLDAKNRLIIPARFRQDLGETFVVTKGLDGCLTLHTEAQWAERVAQLEKLPATRSDVRKYVRLTLARAQECTFDSQGRIQLPALLVKDAGIQRRCAVIGAADHVEIWAEEKWDAYEKDAGEDFESIAESLPEMGR